MSKPELKNPYNRTTQPNEYHKWYYHNVLKPKAEPKPQYFNGTRPLTYQEKKINKLGRDALIDYLFIDLDNFLTMYYKYEAMNAAEKREAKKEYMQYLQGHQIPNTVIDTIKKMCEHPSINHLEAIVIIELMLRHAYHPELITYYHHTPEPIDEAELWEIIPRPDFMKCLRTLHLSHYTDPARREQHINGCIPHAVNALASLKQNWGQAIDEAHHTPLAEHNVCEEDTPNSFEYTRTYTALADHMLYYYISPQDR